MPGSSRVTFKRTLTWRSTLLRWLTPRGLLSLDPHMTVNWVISLERQLNLCPILHRIKIELGLWGVGDQSLLCKRIASLGRKRGISYLSRLKSSRMQTNNSKMRATPMTCMLKLFPCVPTCSIWSLKTLSRLSMSNIRTKTSLSNLKNLQIFKVVTLSNPLPQYLEVRPCQVTRLWTKRYRLKTTSKMKTPVKVRISCLITKSALLIISARETCSFSKTRRNIESFLTLTISVRMEVKLTYLRLRAWKYLIFSRTTESARSFFILTSLKWLSHNRTRSFTTCKNQLHFCKHKK